MEALLDMAEIEMQYSMAEWVARLIVRELIVIKA